MQTFQYEIYVERDGLVYKTIRKYDPRESATASICLNHDMIDQLVAYHDAEIKPVLDQRKLEW